MDPTKKQCSGRVSSLCFLQDTRHIVCVKSAIKDTTDTVKSASYLDLHLEIDTRGRLNTKLYDKRDDLTFQSSTSHF